MLPQQYCLRWKYHHSNLQTMFSQLLDRGCFCDVTLACEGQLIRAHRVVLCACSTFFDTVLTNYASERDPIIIMKDVTFADVKSLIEFMYKGEINVEHANLASLLKTADDLKIKGLAEVSWRDDEDGGGGAGSGGGGVGGLLPTFPDAEFLTHHSPPRTQDTYGGGLHSDLRGSPIADAERRHAGSPAPSGGKQALSSSRLPLLTPIPPSSITIAAAAAASADHYLGPKRKRGRPPLDDAYDVFNVRKLAHYAGHLEAAPSSHHEAGRLHAEEQRRHSSSAYQQHIHQQQRRQRLKHEHQQQQQQQQLHQHLHSHHHHHHQQQQQHATDSEDADDLQTDPEWITSNLEVNVNVGECETPVVGLVQAENGEESLADPAERKQEPNEAKEAKSPGSAREKTPESKAGAAANEKSSPKVDRSKKRSILEKAKEQRQRESREKELRDDGLGQHDDDEQQQQQRQSDHEDDQGTVLPQPVEEIESVQQVLQQQAAAAAAAATTTATSSSGTSSSSTAGDLPSTLSLSQSVSAKLSSNASHAHSSHSHTHSHSHSAHSHIPPAHSHFAKYGTPEGGGYMLNEHGMLMTHDFPPHSVMAAANGSNNNGGGGGDQDFVDIKMEDYDAADLRLTSEEMSQWQDVIKMDDYLAKGRRPQFWEEPFTRRVLDAIKNKRLEMKKAARILGVSYGTLYGRYREVYGCLKHPYSSTFRPSQSSQLAAAVQPRFDIVWPSPKRDSSLLSTPLEYFALLQKSAKYAPRI